LPFLAVMLKPGQNNGYKIQIGLHEDSATPPAAPCICAATSTPEQNGLLVIEWHP
jgi:hypothetical protein